jgi:hypothetical protein
MRAMLTVDHQNGSTLSSITPSTDRTPSATERISELLDQRLQRPRQRDRRRWIDHILHYWMARCYGLIRV